MPLLRGKKNIGHSIAVEMEHGKPQKQSIAIAYNTAKRAQSKAMGGSCDASCGEQCTVHPKAYADGGEADSPEMQPTPVLGSGDKDDMVGRVMAKRMSKGGEVANGPGEKAAEEMDDFDDLSKDDTLEFSYTGENSGDELGDAQEDDDRKDIVSRIMRSRAKKDRNPRPA